MKQILFVLSCLILTTALHAENYLGIAKECCKLCSGFDIFSCVANDCELQSGYRSDTLTHSGKVKAPDLDHLNERATADLWQVNLKDRLTVMELVFFQVLGGYGYAHNGQKKRRMGLSIPEIDHSQIQPFNRQGRGSDSYDPSSTDSAEVFSCKHSGYAWSFDAAVGCRWPLCGCLKVEPKAGYFFESLKLNQTFQTDVNGGYIGLAVPFEIVGLKISPDIVWIFMGNRRECLNYFDLNNSHSDPFKTNCGKVYGLKAGLEVSYQFCGTIGIGLDVRYFDIRSHANQYERTDPVVHWKSSLRWTSYEYLATLSYSF